jgi:hypothetical protein
VINWEDELPAPATSRQEKDARSWSGHLGWTQLRPMKTHRSSIRSQSVRDAQEFADRHGPASVAGAKLIVFLHRAGHTVELRELAATLEHSTGEVDLAAVEQIFAKRAISKTSESPLLTRRNRCLIAIEGANLRKLIEDGRRLAVFRDYEKYKGPDDPSRKSIVDEFGSFRRALREALILDQEMPLALLGESAGRPSGKDAKKKTNENLIRLMARMLEDSFGRRISYESWDRIRTRYMSNAPRAKTVAAKIGWDEGIKAGYEHAKAYPAQFPRTVTYLREIEKANAATGQKGGAK